MKSSRFLDQHVKFVSLSKLFLLVVILVSAAFWNLEPSAFALQNGDYTTYTKTDPSNHIIVYNSTCVKHHIVENETARLWRGEVWIPENFTHTFDARIENASGDVYVFPYMIADALDNRKNLIDNYHNYLTVRLVPATNEIVLEEVDEGTWYVDKYTVVNIIDTWFYFRITKVGDLATCEVFSDPNRTALIVTLTLVLHTPPSYHYIYATQLRNRWNEACCDLLVKNHYIPTRMLWDVDDDGDVDIFDMVAMASCYGSKESDPTYNPNYDIDGDGDIDIFDIVTVASHYGESW